MDTSETLGLTELDLKTRKRVFKGTSVPVGDVWLYVDCGGDEEHEIRRFLAAYPDVKREQLEAWLTSEEEQRLYNKEERRQPVLVVVALALLVIAILGAMAFLFIR